MKRGLVVIVDLDPTSGHEQRGRRPCIVVTDPDVAAHQRYGMIAIVPVTSTPLNSALYPVIEPRPETGITVRSYALTDQIRAVDKGRVRGAARRPLDPVTMRTVDDALRLVLGL